MVRAFPILAGPDLCTDVLSLAGKTCIVHMDEGAEQPNRSRCRSSCDMCRCLGVVPLEKKRTDREFYIGQLLVI